MKVRNKGIDNVKAYAALMVILAHVLNDNYIIQNYESLNIVSKLFNTFFNIVSSTAVPLFLICTGYFLYDKERNFKKILKKNILPLWQLYALWVVLNRPLNSYSILADLPTIIKEILLMNSPWPQYLWYIPALFGIYIMSPLARKLLISLGEKDFKYLFRIVLLITSFDYYVLASRMVGGTELSLNIGINISTIMLFLYPMYGYYFKNYIEKENKNFKKNLILLLLVFIVLFVPQFKLLTNQIGHRIYYYPLGILLSLLTFNTIYHLRFPVILERGLHFISENSLSYYFAHRFVLYNLHKKFFLVNKPINTIVSFVLGVAIVTMLIFVYKGIQKLKINRYNNSLRKESTYELMDDAQE